MPEQKVNYSYLADYRAHDAAEEDEATLRVPLGQWMEGDSLAPPCQSEIDIVPEILELAAVTAQDVVVDLGCGDGRVCVGAAISCGARAIGVEIEPRLVESFRARINARSLDHLVTAVEGDLMSYDLSRATVVYLYLLPDALAEVQGGLRGCLERGGRVVCNTWGLPGLQPVNKRDVGYLGNTRLLLYTKECLSVGNGEGIVASERVEARSADD